MKYKPGDKVRIKSLDWYNENKDEYGEVCVYGDSYAIFIQVMSKFCGQTVTISEVVDDLYGILEDDGDYSWADCNDNIVSKMEIKAKTLFGKECLEPMKLRITIEQIED